MAGYRLSKKQFAVFQSEAEYWVAKFGLFDWELTIRMSDEYPDNRASCLCSDLQNRVAHLILTETWEYAPEDREIRLSAFHEVMELLLMNLRLYLTVIPGVDDEFVDGEVHRVIRIFENVVWAEEGPRRSRTKKAAR